MRIAYLVPEFPGQTHIFFWREIQALKQIGVETTLVSTRRPPQSLSPHSWSNEAQSKTFYVGEVGITDILRSLATLVGFGPLAWVRAAKAALSESSIADVPRNLALIPLAARLARFMHSNSLNHIHSHSCANAAMLVCLASRIAGISYSLSLHGPIGGYGSQQRIKFRYAAFAIAVNSKLTHEISQYLEKESPPAIGQAPMGVDTGLFRRESPFEPWIHGPLRLFSCGRLNFGKGHQELIEAVSILRNAGINAQLEIAGEDDVGGAGFHRDLDELIKKLDLREKVTLLGAVSEERVLQGIRAANIFVLASHEEALGVALMEAMSCEMPVISTNVGGIPELIEHGTTGYLVEPGSPKALADAVTAVMRDPNLQLRIAKAARARIVRDFNSQISARLLHANLASLVSTSLP
jgi:glycosyltransferase involved in cell wall biosynthesis